MFSELQSQKLYPGCLVILRDHSKNVSLFTSLCQNSLLLNEIKMLENFKISSTTFSCTITKNELISYPGSLPGKLKSKFLLKENNSSLIGSTENP